MKNLFLSIVILSGFFATQANAQLCSGLSNCSTKCPCVADAFRDTDGNSLDINRIADGSVADVIVRETGDRVSVRREGDKLRIVEEASSHQ